jgi:hypothetical protein
MVDFYVFLNADCSFIGYTTTRVVTPPTHGRITSAQESVYSVYPPQNQRYPCNLKPSKATVLYYQPTAGYVGPDSAVVDWIDPWGFLHTVTYDLTVR